jgi:hypothetical protein
MKRTLKEKLDPVKKNNLLFENKELKSVTIFYTKAPLVLPKKRD